MPDLAYGGGELELFAGARQWKRYLGDVLAPHLSGHVLEVGAGIGSTLDVLARTPSVSAWTALEPDADLRARLADTAREVLRLRRGLEIRVVGGTQEDLPVGASFDAVIYVDVLEHIDDDRAELARAIARLRRGGRLVVLAPAHAALYSAFDRQIGHRRRYDRASLAAIAPAEARLIALRYLDSVGLLASLANRWLLRAALPTRRQIRAWDGWMVPASRVLDRATFGRLGKSILAVWERSPASR
jgi:SAM-dependent methyltransferase